MKKTALFIMSALILFALILSSCDMLFPPDEEEEGTIDIFIESFTPVTSVEEIIGVRIIVRNSGDEEATSSYSVYLSDTQLLVGAIKVYDGAVTVAGGGNEQIDVLWADVKTWISANSVSVDTNVLGYYIGVKVDEEDAVDESDESNNELVSTERFPIDAIYADGTVTFEVSNAGDYTDQIVLFAVMDDADQDNEFFALGTFTIDGSGNGSATAKTIGPSSEPTDIDWVATGGENYNIGWLIDTDGDFDFAEMDPAPGDIMPYSENHGMFSITSLNGNETVTADFDEFDFYAEGNIIGILEEFSAAVGGDMLFFMCAEGAVNSDPDPSVWILGSGYTQVDSEGNAFAIFKEGFSWDPSYYDTAETYMPAVTEPATTYEFYGVISMTDPDDILNGEAYNVPGDYGDTGFGDDTDPATEEYEGDTIWFQREESDLELMSGLVVHLENFGEYFNSQDIYMNIVDEDGTTNTILADEVESGDPESIIIMRTHEEETYAWNGDEGDYELVVFIDSDGEGDLDVGEDAQTYYFYFDDNGRQDMWIDGNDLEPYVEPIDSETGVYSDVDHPVPDGFVDAITGSNIDQATNPSVRTLTAWEGTDFRVVEFFVNNTVDDSWQEIYFTDPLCFDESITHINFRLNSFDAAGCTNLTLEVIDGNDPSTTTWSNVFDFFVYEAENPPPEPAADHWALYSVPLLGQGANGGLGLDNIVKIRFGESTNIFGDRINCSFYYDDIYFGTDLNP